jgi:hypothetical protein
MSYSPAITCRLARLGQDLDVPVRSVHADPSSAVALDLTAGASCSPGRAIGRVIAAARSSGMATPSSVRWIAAQSSEPLPVVRLQARQAIEPIVDRRRLRPDPLEGVPS